MASTTELTNAYLLTHPSVKDCLKNNVINYSKLSRKIAKELNLQKKTSMEAILIACRRFSAKLKKEEILEEKILNILKKNELEIKNKIVVVVVEKGIYRANLVNIEKKIRTNADIFIAIEGANAFTIILSEKHLGEIEPFFSKKILKISKNLAMITLKCPKEMESTPGVIAYLCSLFAEHGINIVETMSCWTDTIVIIDEKDIPLTMQFLKFD